MRPDGGGASFFIWGTAGGDNGEMAPALDGDGLKNIRPYRIFGLLSYFARSSLKFGLFVICPYSSLSLYIRPYNIVNIQPENSAN